MHSCATFEIKIFIDIDFFNQTFVEKNNSGHTLLLFQAYSYMLMFMSFYVSNNV